MTEPTEEAPPSTFLDSLGPRGRRRAEPRMSIALAGAGCALAVVGVLIVAGDTGAGGDDFNRVPGIVLSALVVAAGLFTLHGARQGPLATAGTVAAALGVPPLMFFLTFDEGGFPPYSTDPILVVSTLAWLAAYVIGPGRGRPFLLGAGLVGAWLTVLQLTENILEFPFMLFGPFAFLLFGGFAPGFDDGFDQGFDSGFGGAPFDLPDPTTLGVLSLAFGLGYLLMARWLDGRADHGVATPFALATLPTLTAGTLFLSGDLEEAGTGLLMMVLGAALAYQGSTAGRRATAWYGGAATAIGAAVFLSAMSDDATINGLLFLAAGIGLVAAGHALATAMREPDEMRVTLIGPPVILDDDEPAPYAPDWTPPPGADEPPPPGHWNPPPPPGAPPSDDEDTPPS